MADTVNKIKKIGFCYQDIDEKGGYPRDVLRLLNELKSKNFEVVKIKNTKDFFREKDTLTHVHIFGIFQFLSVKIAILSLVYKIPYVITTFAHLLPFALKKNQLVKKIYLFVFGKFSIKKARTIHVFTEFEEKTLKSLGINKKFSRISLGLYPEDVPNRTNEIIINKDFLKAPFILFLGRLDIYQKGIDLLIDGFEKYIKEGGRYNLLICGRNWNDGEKFIIDKIKELRIDKIRYIGEVNPLEMDFLMQKAEAFIYPSRFDGPPRPLRYALVKRKKILVSLEANIADNVEENGWGLVFELNADSIAKKLLELEQRVSWPEYKNPLDILSWDKIASQYAELYQ